MDKRLKVLISAYACEPGKGSEPEVGWQWALQMARFHDVTVLTRANNQPGIEAEMSRIQDTQRPRFVYFDLDPFWLMLKDRLRATRIYYVLWQRLARQVVREQLRQEQFDLLHHITFATFRYTTAIWDHGLPTIWGPIGGIESIPAALLPWRYPGPLFSEVVRNFDNVVQTATLDVLRRRAASSSLVLVSTRQMQQTFADLGVASRLMPAIGLHLRQFRIPERAPTAGPLRLLYVGNLLPLKGLDFALRALKVSETNARLTLIGSGPFRRNLEKLAASLGIADRVEFRGRLPREQVLATYKDFDVFLFPSLHDTGGYAVIEAMSNAMPIICLAAGGPDTAVDDGSGICVPLGARRDVVAGLAEAIRTYDRERSRVIEDGRAARQCVDANYDWTRKGELMNACYQEAVRNPKNE
jgi:glycosyltransferase involved in cell wall biosynthesis